MESFVFHMIFEQERGISFDSVFIDAAFVKMAQVENRLIASQNFLEGLKSLPNYADLRQQQYEKVLTTIKTKTLSFAQAAACLPKISEDLWGEEFTLGLKQAVSDQISEVDAKTEKLRLQDYRALPFYLDKGWFEVLAQATGKATALEHLVRLSKKLGLQKPTEPTYATLLALVFCQTEGEFLTEQQKWCLVQEFKPQMKKWFQQSCAVTHFVETLPRDVTEFSTGVAPECISWWIRALESFVHLAGACVSRSWHVCFAFNEPCRQKWPWWSSYSFHGIQSCVRCFGSDVWTNLWCYGEFCT